MGATGILSGQGIAKDRESLSKSTSHQGTLEKELGVGFELALVIDIVELYLSVDLPFFPEFTAQRNRIGNSPRQRISLRHLTVKNKCKSGMDKYFGLCFWLTTRHLPDQ